MANIKDLAKYCNVSISTVSYALNDSNEISEETKARIKAAAKDLNYVPNEGIHGEVRVCLSNSLGFGGHNATLAVKKFEE